jgi:hypothetical protein
MNGGVTFVKSPEIIGDSAYFTPPGAGLLWYI